MVFLGPGVYLDSSSEPAIDLAPLRELADQPGILEKIDLGGADPATLFALDKDGDNRLTLSEYLKSGQAAFLARVEQTFDRFSPDFYRFTTLDTKLHQAYAEVEARKRMPMVADITSGAACAYFRNLAEDAREITVDASGIFFCRGTDLIDAATTVAASSKYVLFDEKSPADPLRYKTTFDTVLSFIPDDRRVEIIMEGLHSPNPEVRKVFVGLIKFAPIDTRFQLYETAFNYRIPSKYDFAYQNNDLEMQRAVMEGLYYLEGNADQTHHLIWKGLRSGDFRTRNLAIINFDRLPDEWISGAISYVLTDDDDAGLREIAANEIGHVPVAQQRMLIEQALLDKNIGVNLAAIRELRTALYRFSHPSERGYGDFWLQNDYSWALDSIKIALRDRHPQVFEEAFEALLKEYSPEDWQLFVDVLVANPNFDAMFEKKKGLVFEVEKDTDKYVTYHRACELNGISEDYYFSVLKFVNFIYKRKGIAFVFGRKGK